jgi:methanogenic corrinoid protein MtbC1
VRTAGGHRRFTRDALDRFIRLQSHEEPVATEVDRWIDALTSDMSHELALVRARSRLGSWQRVADELDPVLVEVGRRWSEGKMSIAEEHILTERLSRALARISESLPLAPNAPSCLLACVESEDHTLGLSLAELCLREIGWASVWMGARSPIESIAERVRMDDRIRLVGLSATEACRDPALLRRVVATVGLVCRERDVALILGGRGPWPDAPAYGARIGVTEGFVDLHKQLRGTRERRSAP